jgi:hypothetical protein
VFKLDPRTGKKKLQKESYKMIPVPQRIGIMVNDNEAYFDKAAEHSFSDKRDRLMRHIKVSEETKAINNAIKEGTNATAALSKLIANQTKFQLQRAIKKSTSKIFTNEGVPDGGIATHKTSIVRATGAMTLGNIAKFMI